MIVKNHTNRLKIKDEVAVHQKHARALVTEVFNSLNVNPKYMRSYFTFQHVTIKVKNRLVLKLPRTNSTRMGINFVLFRACLLWSRFPSSLKIAIHQ